MRQLIDRIKREQSKPLSARQHPTRAQGSSLATILSFLGRSDAVAAEHAVARAARELEAFVTIEATGPGLFTRGVAALVLQQGQVDEVGIVLLAPPVWFYPIPNRPVATPSPPAAGAVPEVAYAVHHWARSWQTRG